jgi:hypothetical protein
MFDSFSLIVAVKDSGAPPTGSLTGFANVTIIINAVNRFDPEFSQTSYEVHIVENITTITSLLNLTALDKDTGINGNINDYKIIQTGDSFGLDVMQDTAQISAMKPLDRNLQDKYLLQVIAIDGGEPPRSGTADISVIVDAYVDKAPKFLNASATIKVPRNTPVNFIIFTVEAIAAEINAKLEYSLTSTAGQYIDCNSYTGKLSLKMSLMGTNLVMLNASIQVTDGSLTSKSPFHLSIIISDGNIYPPVFDSRQYHVMVNESASIGTVLLQLSAKDPDSPALVYSIVDGDSSRRFSIDQLTGILKVYAPIDRELTSSYNLTVLVSDGVSGGADMLNDTATVYITVTDTNEYNPIFTDGSTVQIHVTEGSDVQHVRQLHAIDGDGNEVTYQLYDANETKFSVEPTTGWLNVLTPLIRAIQSQYMIQVTATDNGVPRRQTIIDIIVIVDPATSMISMVADVNTASTTSPGSNVTTQHFAEVAFSSNSASSNIVANTTPALSSDWPTRFDITSAVLLDTITNATTQHFILATSSNSSSVNSTTEYVSSAVHLSLAGLTYAIFVILNVLMFTL